MTISNFRLSITTAQEIFDMSHNLKSTGAIAEDNYIERDEYFHRLLGKDMHVTFNPSVTDSIIEPFKKLLKVGLYDKQEAYYNCYSSNEECNRSRNIYRITNMLYKRIDTNHLIKNEVPEPVMKVIKQEDSLKTLMSPKLSKLLVKLFGERDDIVKWYTNKCPKSLKSGLREDYTITVSILPHHIAGMSYYSSYNHGGARWSGGYKGTSCMDTLKNGSGGNIFGLVSSMRDEYMAIAYLSESENNNIWEPVYEARTLLRLCYLDDEAHIIACRPYYTTNEASHILIDGLKNHFGNVHFVEDIRIYIDGSESKKIKQEYTEPILYKFNETTIQCPICDGTGRDTSDGDWCDECEGDGEWLASEQLPYVDDKDIMYIENKKLVYYLPTTYLKSMGLYRDNIVDRVKSIYEQLRSAV
ncbi:hypothetical protein [Brevibacillus laterosporus]|uniref:hypothetical protein n=1 Tax=Brevibacillus laterosporus TaxID=1465 RepID=UPI003D1A588B